MVVEGSVVVVVRVAKRGRFNSEMLFMKQYFPFAECYYEKEKQKLANIMTYGKDMQKWQRQEPKPKPKEPEEIDRFEECRIFFVFVLLGIWVQSLKWLIVYYRPMLFTVTGRKIHCELG